MIECLDGTGENACAAAASRRSAAVKARSRPEGPQARLARAAFDSENGVTH